METIDPKKVSEEMLKLMKSSFDATFDNVAKIQDLNEKVFKDMLEKSRELGDDAVKMVNDFIENARKGRDNYRKLMEDGYKKMEDVLKTEK